MTRVLLLAFALAADATAVATTMGVAGSGPARLFAAAVSFGVFQGGMAGLGAIGGAALGAWLSAIDHWLALVLLVGIGGKTAWSAWKGEGGEDGPGEGLGVLLALSLATSIDAFAAGVTLPAMAFPLLPAAAIIAAVTFGCSLAGAWLGRAVRSSASGGRARADATGKWMQIAGGLVLCGIGVQTFVEHVTAGG